MQRKLNNKTQYNDSATLTFWMGKCRKEVLGCRVDAFWSQPPLQHQHSNSGSPQRDSVHHCLALPPVSLPVTSAEQVVRTRKVIYAGGVRVTVSGQ